MLSADQLLLITAAVDGELSAKESRAFRLLMSASAEARVLYLKLKADSDRVRALPRVAPPSDLRARVMARIASATPAPVAKPTRHAEPAQPAQRTRSFRERVRPWVPAAVAASVLFCVTAGSFAFFNSQSASSTAKKPTLIANGAGDREWSNWLPSDNDRTPFAPSPVVQPDPASVVRNNVLPVPSPRPVEPDALAVAPEPRPASSDLIGSRLLPPLPPFDLVQARMPFLRAVADVAREDVRQELIDELARDPAFRFDLFVRDTARGVDVFQSAAKAAGITVFADAATLDKLKKRQASMVVIYTESLTASELAALFAKLSAEDAKISPRVCDALHATPATGAEERELKAVLGIDAGIFKRPVGSGGTGQGSDKGDPKPVSAGTVDSVVKTVTAPPAKPGDRRAVLLTWQTTHASIPRTNPAMSKELKSFLDKRGDRKPNAVPAIIIIRPAG